MSPLKIPSRGGRIYTPRRVTFPSARTTLHTRIAEALGWTEADVKSFSLPSLRALVWPVSQELADELEAAIRTGSYYTT